MYNIQILYMIKKAAYLSIIMFLFLGCESQYSKPLFVASGYPVEEILKQVVGTGGEVMSLVPPGQSPHTYSPTPSQVYKVQSAKALFYVSNNLDRWVASLKPDNEIELMSLLPEEYKLSYNNMPGQSRTSHGGPLGRAGDTMKIKNVDPHFWLDPLTVKGLVDNLVDTLSRLDPDHAASYRSNGEVFKKKLEVLDKQVSNILQGVKGRPVFLFHPSFRYMLARYGLVYLGAIESSPGKEPTPQTIVSIVDKIKSDGVKAIFTEPQLVSNPAKAIAEAAGIRVYVLDPVGGVKGRMSYSDMILYNAKTLRNALE